MNTFPGAAWIVAAVFALSGAVTVGGALLAVASRRVIRSVSGLALGSVGLAGLYYFLHSPFLALMEILIYIGAVCVTIVFAVMLAEPDEPPPEQPRPRARLETAAALLVSLAAGGALAWLGLHTRWPAPASRTGDGSVASLGVSLLTTYCLAFELISVVLVLAILGALVLARGGRTPPPST
jgi:NADH:ubiquinone oxidoreductase subunit 6 (subunit J)